MSYTSLINRKSSHEAQRSPASPHPGVPEDAISLLRHDTFGLEFVLATALAIARDETLRRRFQLTATVATDARIQITGLIPNCWLLFQRDGQVTANRAPTAAAFTIDFQQAVAADSSLSKAINATIDRSSARSDARELLGPLTKRDFPTRESVERLVPWAPLLEQMAYRYAARTVGFLNSIRVATASDLYLGRSANLARYWTSAQIAGRATLLASEPEAESWLAGQAAYMTWSPWTPTYPLVRERSLWLACCAARSVAAFGASVVDNYLRSLERTTHHVATFDCLFALLAIGQRYQTTAASIASELELIRLTREHTDHLDKFYLEAIRHLRGRARSGTKDVLRQQLGWTHNDVRGFATRQSLATDPLTIVDGMILGFEMIPIVIAEPQTAFFPRYNAQMNELALPEAEIEKVFRTAWGRATRMPSYH